MAAVLITAPAPGWDDCNNGHRDTPPGQNGIESSCEKPCAEQIINFLGFIRALFGREDASDARKVNATKGDCQDSWPNAFLQTSGRPEHLLARIAWC